ncbi:Cytochrome c heme lyase subunit CcmH [Rubrivivax sp. A210]|uniref:c-type cytochrome biogenesis protein CcmI n=1 Tax=Rubrivivax sp. A210 TaxID=2772301 RepID=UPI00191A512B|nr:c-type cytochrome biogenesis protein CcmI [Rubrivivax sp. A210]CAD5372295.1 Cytochrome c heme lyase subunit CcmH [Rubrivivax sp. A210]
MTMLWIVLALFLIGAMLFLLPPLLNPGADGASGGAANLAVHRDHLREVEQDLAAGLLGVEAVEQARAETRARVVEDATAPAALAAAAPARRSALALALLIPLGSVAAYLLLGNPAAVEPRVAPAVNAGQQAGAEEMQQRIAALLQRLQAEPKNVDGWLTLGRSYTALGRFADAAAAFRRANELTPGNPTLLADLADLTAMTQGRRLTGEPARLIQQALDADPRHPKALALAGSVAFEARDYAAARGYWERAMAVLPPQSDMARAMRANAAEAARLAGSGETAAAPAAGTAEPSVAPTAAAAATAVSGQVTLSPELAARLPAGATLFVFARAAQGPRMPLAILRRPADGRPFEFNLDDTMAMQPQLKISAFPEVVIGARISASGNATPQAGDLVGQSAPVKPGSRSVQVRIDGVQP